MPPSHISIIAPPTGGGFGGKTDPSTRNGQTKLAMITGRPVKIVRPEEVFIALTGPPSGADVVKPRQERWGDHSYALSILLDGGATHYGAPALTIWGAANRHLNHSGLQIRRGAGLYQQAACGPSAATHTPTALCLEIRPTRSPRSWGINSLDMRLSIA
jgi:hypothetical protein